jgi:hypothetical protein
MKRYFFQVALQSLGLLFSPMVGWAAEPEVKAEEKAATPLPEITKTPGSITVDGKLDESAWQEAKPVAVNWAYGRVGDQSKEPCMITKFTWDENYLYIGYETFDKNLVALASDKTEGPKENQRRGTEIWHEAKKVDVVEFFISFGDTHFFWELHQNADNQFNDVWITNLEDDWPLAQSSLAPFGILFDFDNYLLDDEGAGARLKFATQAKPKADGKPSTVNNEGDEDTGYTAELQLPWAALGVPRTRENWVEVPAKEPNGPKGRKHGPWKIDGLEVMIMSVFQNGDLEDRYHHSSPTFKGGWFHKGTADWPRYVLKEQAAK